MGWHNLLITNSARLSVRNSQFHCEQDGKTLTIPLEDITSVTLECLKTTLTGSLLSQLAANNILLLTCDEQHHPNGLLLPVAIHTRPLSLLKLQVEARKPFRKRLWQRVIRQKLLNQAMVLKWRKITASNRLERLAKTVSSGDEKNCEATAARLYFSVLFTDFRRNDDCYINSLLNYGYAVVRAAIARELIAFGFQPVLGIHHASELNSFNLADDLIEPFRAILDSWAIAIMELNTSSISEVTNVDGSLKLSKETRASLTRVLQLQVLIQDENHTLQSAIRLCVKSLVSALRNKDIQLLKLPEPVFPPTLKTMS